MDNRKIIDMQDVLSRFGDDIEEEFLYEITGQSLESLSSNLDKIVNSDYESDLASISGAVHSFKGVASNLGAKLLTGKVIQLEQDIKDGDIASVAEMIREVEEGLKELVEYTSHAGWVEREIKAVKAD